MMSENTKLYNTVQVQKLEAELQLIPDPQTPPDPPLTSAPRPPTPDLNPWPPTSDDTASVPTHQSRFCALVLILLQ